MAKPTAPPPSPPRRTLNISQAMEEARVCRRTIYNWINAGKLDYIRTAGGGVRIYADSLWRTAQGQRIGY